MTTSRIEPLVLVNIEAIDLSPHVKELLILWHDRGSYLSLLVGDIIKYYLEKYLAVIRRNYQTPYIYDLRSHPEYNFISLHRDKLHGFKLHESTVTFDPIYDPQIKHYTSLNLLASKTYSRFGHIHDIDGNLVIAACSINQNIRTCVFVAKANGIDIRTVPMESSILTWTFSSTTLFYLTSRTKILVVHPFDGKETRYPLDFTDHVSIIGYSPRHQGPILYSERPYKLSWLNNIGQVQEELLIPSQPLAIFESAWQRRIICRTYNELLEPKISFVYWDRPCSYDHKFNGKDGDHFVGTFDHYGTLYGMCFDKYNELMVWS